MWIKETGLQVECHVLTDHCNVQSEKILEEKWSDAIPGERLRMFRGVVKHTLYNTIYNLLYS